jgi:hypothetical protein
VTKKAIKKGAVTKKAIRKGAVTTPKLADEAVTGAKADEASFQGVIKGDGRQSTSSFTAPASGFLPQPIILAEVPTMGVVQFIACFDDSPAGADMRVQLLSFDDSTPFFAAGTVIAGDNPVASGDATVTEQMSGFFSGGGGTPLIAQGPAPPENHLGTSGWWDFHLSRGTGNDTLAAHVTVSGHNTSTDPGTGECTVTATVEYQD